MSRILRIAALLLLVASVAGSQTSRSFRIPDQGGVPVSPLSIASGPDGAMWFTSTSANLIGRITATGDMTFFQVPSAASGVFWITAGPDGNLWFTETNANRIGRIDPRNGQIVEFQLPVPGSQPQTIVTGPDGALWFAENARRVGRITTAGVISEFATPPPYGYGYGIAANGENVWVTQRPAIAAIARVKPDGSVSEVTLPPPHASPYAIVRATDGATWYTDLGGSLGRIEDDGAISIVPLGPGASPVALAAAADGGVWVADYGGSRLWRVDRTALPLPFPCPDGQPQAVAVASDGAIWATVPNARTIFRMISPFIVQPPVPAPTPTQTPAPPRRRAAAPPIVKPELPPCVSGIVASDPGASLTDLMLTDDRIVVADRRGDISSIGKNGGSWIPLGELNGRIVRQVVADATHLYFLGEFEDESAAAVYSLSKKGGTPVAITADIPSSVSLVSDGNYLYVVSLGTPAGEEDYLSDGAVLRIRKDGSEIVKLASNLSMPYALAVSGGDVFFSELGFAIGNVSTGLRRVSTSGGAVTRVLDGVMSLSLAADATSLYFDSYDLESEELAATLRSMPRAGGVPRDLYTPALPLDLKVIGDRLVYVDASFFAGTLTSLPIGGGTPTVISSSLSVPRFAYDDCLFYFATTSGNVARSKR